MIDWAYIEKIHGWAHFAPFYLKMVQWFPDHSKFVEIGSWKGKSACYMGAFIQATGKKIKFFNVDHFKGEPNIKEQQQWVKEAGGSTFPDCVMNLTKAGVLDYVTPIKLPSVEAAALFPDKSLDFIYIDGCHLYEECKADIEAWSHKLKINGVIAGDDYHKESVPGVYNSVNEFFPGTHRRIKDNTWVHFAGPKEREEEFWNHLAEISH